MVYDAVQSAAGFTHEPLGKTEVTVSVPDWLRVEEVFAMPLAEKISFQANDDRIDICLEELEFARMLVLTRDKGLGQRLAKSCEETLKRRKRIAQTREQETK